MTAAWGAVHRRHQLVETLRGGTEERQALPNTLDISRSTVERGLQMLAELDLVESTSDGVTLTAAGELVAQEYESVRSYVARRYGFRDRQPEKIDELIEIVDQRQPLLECLHCERKDKRSLAESVSFSRSTVNRGIRELEAVELVTYRDGGFELTDLGVDLLYRFTMMKRCIEYIEQGRDLLTRLPRDCDVDPALLLDAEIVEPPAVAPHIVGERIETAISGADRVRGLVRAHSYAKAMDCVYEEIRCHGMEMEVVIPRAVSEYLRTKYPKRLSELLKTGNLQFRIWDDIPYGFFLIEENETKAIYLLVYSDENDLKGVIINYSSDSVEWAERVFQRYKRRADLLNVTDPASPGDEQTVGGRDH